MKMLNTGPSRFPFSIAFSKCVPRMTMSLLELTSQDGRASQNRSQEKTSLPRSGEGRSTDDSENKDVIEPRPSSRLALDRA